MTTTGVAHREALAASGEGPAAFNRRRTMSQWRHTHALQWPDALRIQRRLSATRVYHGLLG